MALRLEDKQQIVAEVHQAAGGALAAVVADYRGLTVDEMTDLRRKARDSGVYLKVVRNTLLKRAVQGTDLECLTEAATGPTMVAFSTEEPGAAARLLRDCAKELEALDVRAVSISGKLLPAEDIDRVAKLPTREEAIAQLMSVMLAPVGKLARTLNEVPGKLVRTTAALKEQKEQAQTGQTGQTGQTEQAEQAEQPEQPERTGQAEQAEQADQTEQAEQTDQKESDA